MKLKYYLRGLGIGIVVTAVIMGVSANGKPVAMTDAQIVARARELGMVDGVLRDLQTSETETAAAETEEAAVEAAAAEIEAAAAEIEAAQAETEAAQTEETAATQAEAEAAQPETESGAETETSAEEPEAGEAQAAEEPGEPEAAEEQVTTEEPAQSTEIEQTVIVTVYPGEGSYTVSRKLAALGLVESADIYDTFLCQNGYDKKIITGNHEIKVGMTADEIARALTIRSH